MSAAVLQGGGDQDILDRFASVTGRSEGWVQGGEGWGGWREGEEREDIRRQLALEREDLEICFVNEIASDEEGWEVGEFDTVANQIGKAITILPKIRLRGNQK